MSCIGLLFISLRGLKSNLAPYSISKQRDEKENKTGKKNLLFFAYHLFLQPTYCLMVVTVTKSLLQQSLMKVQQWEYKQINIHPVQLSKVHRHKEEGLIYNLNKKKINAKSCSYFSIDS